MAACRPSIYPVELEQLLHNAQQTTLNSVQAYQSFCNNKSTNSVSFVELVKLLKVSPSIISTYQSTKENSVFSIYQTTQTKVRLLDRLTWTPSTQRLSIYRPETNSDITNQEEWIEQQVLARPDFNLSIMNEILQQRGLSPTQIRAALFFQLKNVESKQSDYVDQLLRLFNLSTGLVDYGSYLDQLTPNIDICTIYQFSEQLEHELIAAINASQDDLLQD